jgi:peptidyl-prolyl cis-trans isomerase B (cyclophilin B)
MRASSVVVAMVLAGCASGPSTEERDAEARRIRGLADVTVPQPDIIEGSLIRMGRDLRTPESAATDASIRLLAPALDGGVQAAFDVGASGSDMAAEVISKGVGPDATPEVVAAAAMGLAYCKADGAEALLVDLALRPSQPPEALEALFSYYRMRGSDKTPPATLPDDRLLAYAKHPTARGRAALGHLGRVIKDPALVGVLGTLAVSDPDFEVRRAALLGLAEGPPKKERPADLRATCLDFIRRGLADADQHVVAAACRAAASYDDPAVPGLLLERLTHPDFNVRVAALEGLGKRKSKDAAPEMLRLARSDDSTSVRYTAGVQLAEIDPAAAQALVQHLLLGRPPATTAGGPLPWKERIESEYVRCAGVEILAKSEDLTAPVLLASVAKSDPSVRVRETAVGAFEGRKDSQIAKGAIKAAIADSDPVVVATACGVVAKNEWRDLLFDAVQRVPERFPGCAGADAREAAITAISDVDLNAPSAPAHGGSGGGDMRPFFVAYLHDPNPAVRAAAEKAIAKLDKKDPPKVYVRGADLTGELLPGGAPIFDKDAFLVVETNKGTMKIRLFPDQAPVHCAHVASLAMRGFYDGLTWHRVVPDFVIQGGCPRGDGSGNAGVTLPLEPTRIPFERGTLGMPRSDHPDTGGCQLFICHSRAPHLDVRYTAFGKVVEGLDVIDKIDVDDKILHVRVEGAR